LHTPCLLSLLLLLLLQRWKSNPMYWCELCRVWMNDSKAAKMNHERGTKHQENLARSKRHTLVQL
jgi:WW domain-binding protein 4